MSYFKKELEKTDLLKKELCKVEKINIATITAVAFALKSLSTLTDCEGFNKKPPLQRLLDFACNDSKTCDVTDFTAEDFETYAKLTELKRRANQNETR